MLDTWTSQPAPTQRSCQKVDRLRLCFAVPRPGKKQLTFAQVLARLKPAPARGRSVAGEIMDYLVQGRPFRRLALSRAHVTIMATVTAILVLLRAIIVVLGRPPRGPSRFLTTTPCAVDSLSSARSREGAVRRRRPILAGLELARRRISALTARGWVIGDGQLRWPCVFDCLVNV
jgi:hypothetical protein